MNRNNAEKIYYFNKDFFQMLFRELDSKYNLFQARLNNKVIASTLALPLLVYSYF